MATAALAKRATRLRNPGVPTPASELAAFRRRLGELVQEAGGSPYFLAKKIGISEGAVRNYVDRQGDPSRAVLVRMAQACGVRLEWLVLGTAPRTPGEVTVPGPAAVVDGVVWVPRVLGNAAQAEVSGSHPVPFSRELLEERWRFNLDRLGAVTVEDDSMEPLLCGGDLVLVNRCQNPDPAAGGANGLYALFDDGRLCLRRVAFQGRSGVKVSCENRAYEDLILSPDEARERLRLVGRVTWSGRRVTWSDGCVNLVTPSPAPTPVGIWELEQCGRPAPGMENP